MSGGLPAGWVEVQLEDIIKSLESGKRPKGGAKGISEGIPSIGAEHLNDVGGFNFTNMRYVPEQFYKGMLKGHIAENDILIVKDGATTGKASFVCCKFPFDKAVVNEHVFVVKIAPPLNQKFVFYFLWSNEGNRRILENFQGSAQGGINRQFVSRTLIPVACLNEQKRIVAKLDDIIPRIDSVQERFEKIPAILKRFRQSVLNAAVTGKLTEKWREERPEGGGWGNGKLKNVCNSISDGDHQAPPKEVEGIPFLVISNIKDNKIDFESITRFVSRDYFNNLKPIRIPKINDILYTVTGSIGNSVVVRDNIDFCFQRHISIIKPNNKLIDVEYLNYYLNTDLAMEQGRACATGTAQLTIPLSGLREYEIPLPSLDEQKEIVRQVDKLFAFADKVEERYQKARVKVDALAQSVLAKAFRGELVSQNPDDEPAGILLQRIQEEKAKMEAELKIASKGARKARRNAAKPQEKKAGEP